MSSGGKSLKRNSVDGKALLGARPNAANALTKTGVANAACVNDTLASIAMETNGDAMVLFE